MPAVERSVALRGLLLTTAVLAAWTILPNASAMFPDRPIPCGEEQVLRCLPCPTSACGTPAVFDPCAAEDGPCVPVDPCSPVQALAGGLVPVQDPLRIPCRPCGYSVASDRETVWTHDGWGGGYGGFQAPSVVVTPASSAWVPIPASSGAVPKYIWKQNPSSTGQTILPVMFEPHAIRNCAPISTPATLRISADNAWMATWNGNYVASCGQLYYAASPQSNCFSSIATLTLWVQPNQLNKLVVYVWNQGGPAMLQYRLDY